MYTTETHIQIPIVWSAAASDTDVDHARRARLRAAATLGITVSALAGFAINTVLARLAMSAGHIAPASYTAVRLLSTAVALGLVGSLVAVHRGNATATRSGGSWLSAALLLGSTMASTTGLARLPASTGALVFFVTAQATMLGAGMARGDRPSRLQWAGVLAAVAGLVWLLAPGASGPSPVGATLMVAAGTCWGCYSLRGRTATDAFAATRGNFLRCLPVAVPAAALLLPGSELSLAALAPPIASGAVASSLGSVLWYVAARRLTATRAATAQLTVPVLSALGGTVLLSEPVTARMVLAGALVLAGTAVAMIRAGSAVPDTP